MDIVNQAWVIAGTAYAMVLGGAVGYERELKDRPAGFRTHMLVAGAATLLIEIGELLMFDARYRGSQFIQIDPLRLVEAVVSGVAFIGADGPNDVSPSGLPQGVGLHQLALVAMGVSIFDNLDFERAVEEARRLNRYEFLFMAAPLRVEKGTGSPLNPLAIF